MSDFVLIGQHSATVIEFTAERRTYSIEDAAQFADVNLELLRYYCQTGLLGEDRKDLERVPVFDDDALYEVRRIEHYRRQHRVNLRALPLVVGLLREIDSLRAELRFLRNP